MWLWSKERRERLEESQRALERSQRLGWAIDHLAAESREVASWARETLEENHLAELFARGARGSR